jgi:uncharacterized RDD family membrane protein YckC
MAAGRANLDTKAKLAGSEEWHRLGEYPDFNGSALPPPVAGAPAVAIAGAVPGPTDITRLAGHGARIGAALLNALLYFLSFIPGALIGGMKIVREHPELRGGITSMDQFDPTIFMSVALWVWGGLFVAMALQVILISTLGQSLGKLVVGARVVRTSGERAGFLHGALLRYIIPVGIFLLLSMIPLIGLFFALIFLVVDLCFMFRDDRRCLHDLLADTTVVKK